MHLQAFLDWLQHTGIGTAIRESTVLFPWLESIHVLAITSVVGTIAIVDMRLLGWTSKDRPASQLMDEILPFTRGAFIVAAITGSLLFISHAPDYMQKTPFIAKLILLVAALINIGVFHLVTTRTIHTWDTSPRPPALVRWAGGLSLALWIGVVACGRWTGFV